MANDKSETTPDYQARRSKATYFCLGMVVGSILEFLAWRL